VNAIVVLIDSLRFDHMGFLGGGRTRTPNLDRLAERSTVFTNTYLGSYPCMPARRDLWTGRFEFPWRGWNPLEPDDETLPGVLSRHGHTSMLVSDHYHLWEKGAGNYHFDFDGFEFIRGQELDKWVTDPTVPIEYPASSEKLARHCGPEALDQYLRNTAAMRYERDRFAPQVFERAGEWLEKNHRRPDGFFLMIDCFDPHEPFDPPAADVESYAPNYRGERVIWPNYGECDLSEEELEYVRALYSAELTMVDRWLGRFLDKAEQLGLFEDTAIVVTTDHGHLFGEHGLMGKPWAGISDSNLYQELVHVPLLVHHPRQWQPGGRRSELVQLVDIFPTVAEALGVEPPAGIHGRSLLPVITGEREERAPREFAVFGRFGEALNITDGEWTLFWWPTDPSVDPVWYSSLPPQFGGHGQRATERTPDGGLVLAPTPIGKSMLFNVERDPGQKNNLIDQRPEQVERLRRALGEWLTSIAAPDPLLARFGFA
jgi:arylsulfatase A-like enzyme